MAQEIDRIVRLLERELITRSEFFNSMLEALVNLPAGEKESILDALAGHSSEMVRNAVVDVEAFVRNQELSRDIQHIRRNSPLRPGICLELRGSREYYSSEDRPWWLNGRECRGATFVRFERLSKNYNLTPAALIAFYEAIDMPGHKGRYGVLFARYGCDYPAWTLREGSVALCVVEALPDNMEGFCDSHPFTERHACYRVKETPDEPSGSNG
ncbi:MAG: hypothetical protein ACKVP0_06110 [Pirellulaceae bacterium]